MHTGALVVCLLLGVIWLVVAARGRLEASFRDVPSWRYLLLPLALFIFWSLARVEETAILPDFDPRNEPRHPGAGPRLRHNPRRTR